MRTNRFAVGFGAIVLACVCVVGGLSAAATGGDQNDPLVTLSYLTQVVTPELMQKVDEQVAANEQALAGKLDAAINEYSEEMKQVLSQGGGESSSYVPVVLEAGQSMMVEAGSELLMRSGTVKIASGTFPVLVNATSGNSLDVGEGLNNNNLYVAPMEGVVVTAFETSVIMVHGMYAVA